MAYNTREFSLSRKAVFGLCTTLAGLAALGGAFGPDLHGALTLNSVKDPESMFKLEGAFPFARGWDLTLTVEYDVAQASCVGRSTWIRPSSKRPVQDVIEVKAKTDYTFATQVPTAAFIGPCRWIARRVHLQAFDVLGRPVELAGAWQSLPLSGSLKVRCQHAKDVQWDKTHGMDAHGRYHAPVFRCEMVESDTPPSGTARRLDFIVADKPWTDDGAI